MRAALSKKEHRILRDGFVQQGCTWRESAHNFLYTTPDGQTFGVAKTASDSRSSKNSRADARRAGMHWPLDGPPPTTPTRKERPMTATNPVIDLQQRDSTARARALTWLRAYMDGHTEVRVSDLQTAASVVRGFGQRALAEAMREIGDRRPSGGTGSPWVFRLNESGGKTAAELLAEIRHAQEEKPVDEVRTDPEYDRGLEEGMEAGAEEIATLQRQLADANEEIGRLQLDRATASAARDAAQRAAREQVRKLVDDNEVLARDLAVTKRALEDALSAQRGLVTKALEAQEMVDEWKRSEASQQIVHVPAPSPVGTIVDDSWVLSEDEIGDQSLTALQRAGRSFGLRIEVRARRA